jgi:hypothetical protein
LVHNVILSEVRRGEDAYNEELDPGRSQHVVHKVVFLVTPELRDFAETEANNFIIAVD